MSRKRMCKPGEVVHDLQRDGLHIIQGSPGSRFGLDAVLLSSYAQARPGERVMDLCSGTGVIPILMHAKNPGAVFYGMEIQADLADMAARSVAQNNIEHAVTILTSDIRRVSTLVESGTLDRESFDVVTVNPPYIRADSARERDTSPQTLTRPASDAEARAVARQEILCVFEDVATAARTLLRFGGRMYAVHRTDRLTDVLCALRGSGLEPKAMRLVQSAAHKPPSLFLLKAVKGAAPGLVMETPLAVRDACGAYSQEIKRMYGDA